VTIEIRLHGEAAHTVAEAAEQLLLAASATKPECHTPVSEAEPKRGDPVAMAALILSVPGAVLATMDIAARLRVVERVRALLQKARTTKGTVLLQVGAQPPLDLARASEDEVTDRLHQRAPD
jgi:hypothetical protein